jgi:hypothetical protein
VSRSIRSRLSPRKALGRLKASFLQRRITSRTPGARVVVQDPFQRIRVVVGTGATFHLGGSLIFAPWEGNRGHIYIKLEANSRLEINGDFVLGPECRLIVSQGAHLVIGGRDSESSAGLTERSLIMVQRKVSIGTDFVCSWGVFITDSDWHAIDGVGESEETFVGDHVWATPNCSILKGSRIGSGSILATGTVTRRATFPNHSLIGGAPAKVLAANRSWSRDLPDVE